MTFYIFITISFILNILLFIFLKFKKYDKKITYPLLGLSIVFPVSSIISFSYINNIGSKYWLFKLYCILYISSSLLINEFVKNFLQENEIRLPFLILKRYISITSLIRITGLIAIVLCLLFPLTITRVPFNNFLNYNGIFVISVQLIIVLYSLFILENTFRFAQKYQRNIGRLCFLSLLLILIFQLCFSTYLLLYNMLNEKLIYVSFAVYGIAFPFLLVGLIRYRLGTEYIAIPQNAVFYSVSLLLSAAVFLGIGFTVAVFRYFNIDFTYFEKTLIIFSLCFFVLLVIGSGTIRKRISRFISSNFYFHKFDYREQFFNLHRSYMTGENVENTLTEIIENMKFSVTAVDAFIFLKNDADGHFYMHENKESATASDCIIRGDSRIVAELSQKLTPFEFNLLIEKNAMLSVDSSDTTFIKILKADIVFPIECRNQLLGILALKLEHEIKLDNEDIALVEIFAQSIGDVIFKNKMLTERVESKQFESFSRLSSFIIHDIKNQIATLSLLSGNAEKNIDIPEFRKSLLVTLKSCTVNLESLVEKLKSPPQTTALKLKRLDINIIIDRVIENTGIQAIKTIEFTFKRNNVIPCEMDEESLFYAVKNIVVNSLDAMNKKGKLVIETGKVNPLTDKLLHFKDSGKEFFFGYNNYIMVSDSGCGMSREFIEEKLFHPFITTKDKGFGIGLYQCKTLIEKMGGKIICRSEIGHGTDFCILL
jgi:putative PEP-CTERM system histidine kinase